MKYSSLTERVSDEGVDAWAVHYDALARQEAGEDIIMLSVGQETDEVTPAVIVDAAVDSLRRGRHHYTYVEGNPELRRAIARRHREVTGQAVSEASCVVFSGTQNALFAVAQCLLEQGDEVILVEPYYTTYPATFSASGATVISVPTRIENGFQPDLEAIAGHMTSATRAIVVNSPNNPVGTVYRQDLLASLVDLCRQHGIWLVCDDVYQELLLPQEKTSAAGVEGADEVCITVSSLSKSHRMTGWRLGWAIGPETLARHLSELSMCMSYGLPTFIQDAGLAAFESGTETAREIRRNLDRRRQLVVDRLQHADGFELFGAPGGMFVVFDISGLPLDAKAFARGLLDRHDVAILPCDGFGSSGSRLLRLSLCAEDDRLEAACERILAYLVEPDVSGRA